MLAEKNEAIKEAETTMRKLNADERIKMQCEAREQIEHDMASAYQHGVDEGEKRGLECGLERGAEQEKQRYSKLVLKLTEEGKIDLLVKAASDADVLEQLYENYGIE